MPENWFESICPIWFASRGGGREGQHGWGQCMACSLTKYRWWVDWCVMTCARVSWSWLSCQLW